MDLQQVVSLAIVGATAAILLWHGLSRRRFRFKRGMQCGCGFVSGTARRSSIVYRARKGERPRVLVKMR
jgi:hypothetical protein